MSEYIEIETEIDEDDPQIIHFYTNLPLTVPSDKAESYDSPEALAEGSAVAQLLALIDGIERVSLVGGQMRITRAAEMPEHALIADVSAALKDFFL